MNNKDRIKSLRTKFQLLVLIIMLLISRSQGRIFENQGRRVNVVSSELPPPTPPLPLLELPSPLPLSLILSTDGTEVLSPNKINSISLQYNSVYNELYYELYTATQELSKIRLPTYGQLEYLKELSAHKSSGEIHTEIENIHEILVNFEKILYSDSNATIYSTETMHLNIKVVFDKIKNLGASGCTYKTNTNTYFECIQGKLDAFYLKVYKDEELLILANVAIIVVIFIIITLLLKYIRLERRENYLLNGRPINGFFLTTFIINLIAELFENINFGAELLALLIEFLENNLRQGTITLLSVLKNICRQLLGPNGSILPIGDVELAANNPTNGGKKQDYTKTTEKYGSRCVYLSKRKGRYLKIDGTFVPYKSAVKILDKKRKTHKNK